MRFALLGNHPDGLAFARALVHSGRHEVAAVTTPLGDDDRQTWGDKARLVRDLEEVLADPSLEAVIVAGTIANRPVQLRRALQSERHVVCVHPADVSPDTAYEAALIQQDTGLVLLPLLPMAIHPAIPRALELLRRSPDEGGVGAPQLIELELTSREQVLLSDGQSIALPGWDVLRRLGGEVAEVTTFAERQEVSADAPLFVSGSFLKGGQIQLSFRPRQSETRGRLAITAEKGSLELTWPEGLFGPTRLRGPSGEETWPGGDSWRAVVEVFEQHLIKSPKARAAATAPLAWQDEVRCLELDDAIRRSAAKRRSVPLEYPEATEEAGFKGTMTLLGCGLLWVIVLLLIVSVWVPLVGWLVLPALAVFLGLQSLLWVARKPARTRATVRRQG